MLYSNNFGYYTKLANNFYLVAVAFKPADKGFKLSNVDGFDSATYDYSLVAFNTDEFLAEYARNEVVLTEVFNLDDFFIKTAEIYKAKALKRFKVVNTYYSNIRMANLLAKIDELKANFATKKAELTEIESELAEVLNTVKTLENANDELLNAETLDTKAFQQNSLKIAKLKHSNKALIDNRNALFNKVSNLESELKELESELKELESV